MNDETHSATLTGSSRCVSIPGGRNRCDKGRIIQAPLTLNPKGLGKLVRQDDMYVNMALLQAVIDNGLNATSADFAKEFTHGGFPQQKLMSVSRFFGGHGASGC